MSRRTSLSTILFIGLLFVTGCPDRGGAAPAAPAQATPAPAPQAPLIPKTQIVDWCKEHGVPESQCTRCNAALAEEFKKKGDWCKEHGLPESQCTACNPGLKAKFEAMAPKNAGQ